MSLIEKIKLLFVFRKPVTELVGEIQQAKTGWKTIPFWISIVGTLATIAAGLQGIVPVATALIITTAITVIYNILRAIQNAGQPGVTPIFQSTRFWVGILGIVSAGITSLQSGGINPAWLTAAAGLIATVMAASQSIGAQ